MSKRISFDFDGTLDKTIVQEYAKELISRGYNVFICTSRLSNDNAPNPKWNDDLYEVAKYVGIPNENIIFQSFANKWKFFENTDFIWHLDDDQIELNMINKYTNTIGISVFGQTNWKSKCEKLLK